MMFPAPIMNFRIGNVRDEMFDVVEKVLHFSEKIEMSYCYILLFYSKITKV